MGDAERKEEEEEGGSKMAEKLTDAGKIIFYSGCLKLNT